METDDDPASKSPAPGIADAACRLFMRAVDNLGLPLTVFLLIYFFTSANGLFNALSAGFGIKYPRNTFLFRPDDLFADYVKAALSLPGIDPAEAAGWSKKLFRSWVSVNPSSDHMMWLPPATLSFYMSANYTIGLLGPNTSVALFEAFWISCFLVLFWRCRKTGRDFAFLALSFLLSYPVLFTVTRGNVAGLVCFCVAAFFLCGFHFRQPMAAALFLAFAINLKLTPALFLGALLSESFHGRAKVLVWTPVFSILVFASSYSLVKAVFPWYDLGDLFAGFSTYNELYVARDAGMAHGSSLLGMLKFFFGYSAPLRYIPLAVCLLFWGYALFVRAQAKLYPEHYAFILTMLFVAGSPVTGDYYLTMLFIPILLSYVRLSRTPVPQHGKKSSLVIVLGALLTMFPKNYFFEKQISYQVVLNPLLLIAFSALVLRLAAAETLRLPRRVPEETSMDLPESRAIM